MTVPNPPAGVNPLLSIETQEMVEAIRGMLLTSGMSTPECFNALVGAAYPIVFLAAGTRDDADALVDVIARSLRTQLDLRWNDLLATRQLMLNKLN